MGFLPEIRKILRYVPSKRQTLFFSATMPPPIAALTSEMLRNPVSIQRERQAAPASGITQAIYPVSQGLKPALLVTLLQRGDVQQALVFTRTKHRANRLADHLVKAGIRAERIHGNRSQAQRTAALEGFKSGRFPVLVATDIAARGIDIDDVTHVVNFDVPEVPETYVHRIGRTARAGASGMAMTFIEQEERADWRNIVKLTRQDIPIVEGPPYQSRIPMNAPLPTSNGASRPAQRAPHGGGHRNGRRRRR
jgi:ATP-dependent RNA helicase RhlE